MFSLLIWNLLQMQTHQQCQPYGERLSLGYYYTYLEDDSNYITLTFNTQELCNSMSVKLINPNQNSYTLEYVTTEQLNMSAIYEFSPHLFNYKTYIHSVRFGSAQNLIQGSIYTYSVQYDGQNYKTYNFRVPNRKLEQDSKIIVFGDMDSEWSLNISKPTFDWFQKQVENNVQYDAIIFTGDMAYDLEDDDCQKGDDWLRNITLFTSKYPFMIAAGNHDNGKNNEYSFIRKAFSTPRIKEYDTTSYYNDMYSYILGGAYFISFNPYKIAYSITDPAFEQQLYKQMKNELMKAQDISDWIIVYNHYPMYCSNMEDKFCQVNHLLMSKFEELYVEYHVDLLLAGHQHSYERDEPLFKNKTAQYTSQDNGHIYLDAKAPLHIVEGAGGNAEIKYQPDEIYPNQFFTKHQAVHDGVGILTIKNKTHLYFEHIMMKDEKVEDYFWLIKNNKQINTSSEYIIWIFVGVAGFILLLLALLLTYRYYRKRVQKNKTSTFEDE